MKKLVIFDLDGTLVDSLESISFCCNTALEKCGFMPIDINEYKNYAGDGTIELLKRALHKSGDTEYKFLNKMQEEYLNVFEEGCLYNVKSFKNIDILLEKLKKNNIKIAVLSNKLDSKAQKVVEKVFGKNYFDFVLGQKGNNPIKPDPFGVDLILKELKISCEESLYIGDTDTDMMTGKNSKLKTVGVTWGFRTEEELLKNGADFIVSDPLEIFKLV